MAWAPLGRNFLSINSVNPVLSYLFCLPPFPEVTVALGHRYTAL